MNEHQKLNGGNGNGASSHRHAGRNGAQASLAGSDSSVKNQAQELMALFLSLARELLAIDDSAADLPLRQLRVCMVLFEGARSLSALSRELGVSLSAMTQIADRLERARLVTRQFEGTDRRVRSLQLTPRAQKIMQAREDARVHRAQLAFDRLAKPVRSNILDALGTLLTACQEAELAVASEIADHTEADCLKGPQIARMDD